MENDIRERLRKKMELCCDSLFQFSVFVGEIEFLAEQNPEVFVSQDMIDAYKQLWFELEIINACALSDWEKDAHNFTTHDTWKKNYAFDARKGVHRMKDLMNM